MMRPLMRGWRPRYASGHFWHSLMPLVARFELDARDAALHSAGLNQAGAGKALLPFLDAEVAVLMADWLFRLKSTRKITRAWFGRHGLAAVPFLVPDALGKSRPARRKAVAALFLVAGEYGPEAVVDAARGHGDEAAGAVAEALRAEPPATDAEKAPPAGPARPPAVRWADPAALPRLVLRDGGRAVPLEATGHVVSLLALSGSVPAEGLDEVHRACTPESLAAFSWEVFESWRRAGEPSRNGWVLSQLVWFGDDETARRLSPIIRAWPGQSGHAKAVRGLEVLTSLGTDVALIQLNGIAQKVKYTGLREAARKAIGEAARVRGLTAEQLADRLVPGFELDAGGGMTLDYGPRAFRVGFDEQLKPYVVDGAGKLRKALPKPGAKDDPELAPAAYKRFATLKKDVRSVAADQLRRLEGAMVAGRRWTPEEFGDFFVDHPLMWHIARRVVWGADGRLFRIAEDRTLAGAGDEVFTLAGSAAVGIAHPLRLDEGALAAWVEVFADYEILQPFPQLGRPVHALTEEERASDRLERFEGVTVPVGRVLGLTRHGWQRGHPQDNGIEHDISLPLGDGRRVVIDLSPGIAVGAVNVFPEVTLDRVGIGTGSAAGRSEHGRTFGGLDPVAASELIAALTDLTRN